MSETLTDNTILNSDLVNVSYSTVLRAIELTGQRSIHDDDPLPD